MPKDSMSKSKSLKSSVIIVAVSAIFFIFIYTSAPTDYPTGKTVHIPENASLNSIANILADNNVVKSTLLFKIYTYTAFGQKKLKAGDYLMAYPESSLRISHRLINGEQNIPRIKVTLFEGYSVKDMARAIKKSVPDFDSNTFTDKAGKYEGYLFPDTYNFFSNVSPDEVIKTLQNAFDEKTRSLKTSSSSGRSFDEIIKMASIVEKEATSTKDRGIIAGILWKRIDIGMPLQVDPPFFYFLNKDSSELTLNDLKIKSPYNLYLNKGLPPTPIDNPGLDAIIATMNPVKTSFWYYLSDKNGNMHYAVDHDGHVVNKEKYLR